MDKIFWAGVLVCLMIFNVQAQTVFDESFSESQPLREYFVADEKNYNKLIIYFFTMVYSVLNVRKRLL